jgi:hypothetical protein
MPLVHRRWFTPGLHAFGLVAAAWAASSCNAPIDTTRQAPPKATLGDDVFGVFCDRVGASAITEDLAGASYQALCHYAANGMYGDAVDERLLPKPQGDAAREARKLALAKMDAMRRHRSEFIRAINVAFPDIAIDDAANPGQSIRLHDAFLAFGQEVTPLYESNPYASGDKPEPLLPSSTRAIARMLDSLTKSPEARAALAKIWGRKGYRPSQVNLGVLRPALAYPGLRAFAKASLGALAPDKAPSPELQQLFRIGKQELLHFKADLDKLAPLTVNAATHEPNRPRSAIELASAVFLSQSDLFAKDTSAPAFPIARRDRRGFVVTNPGGPFVDRDGDGFPDIDGSGRFLDASGKPLDVAPPFRVPNFAEGDDKSLYAYIDTARTAIGAASRHLTPLVDATKVGSGPDAWKSEHETLMYALAGAGLLLGDREPAVYDYATGTRKNDGASCPSCVSYQRFKSEQSPLPDLAHAAGQILADPESDALLGALIDLLENHEDQVARVLGDALTIREIAGKHDALAAQGKEPLAALAYETPIWDEFAALIGDITKKPGLLAQLVQALAQPAIVKSHDGARHMGDTLAARLAFRDQYTYNPADLNGKPLNVTVGQNAVDEPRSPVDYNAPRVGGNRSMLQRAFQLIHDANGGPACNKQGARVKVKVGSGNLTWPVPPAPGYTKCELFRFENLATFYLDALLPSSHPKRSKLVLQDGTLNELMKFLGNFVSPDKVFSESSGITDLTTHPSPVGLNRLVFFGATSDVFKDMPDIDPFIGAGMKNEQTNIFISNLLEPISAAYCPPDAGDANKAPQCPTKSGTLRIADANGIFTLEKLGFYEYLEPIVTAFADAPCDAAKGETPDCGERLFVRAIDIFYKHWAGKDHGPECDQSDPKRACSEAGVYRYEPIAAEAFRGDIVPALHAFAVDALKITTTISRGPNAGKVLTAAEVLEKLTRILFSVDYATQKHLVDRSGSPLTKWVDGTAQPQVTIFNLLADGLHKMDLRFEEACKGKAGADLDACKEDTDLRRGQWRRARSQLVDEFLGVEGTAENTRFKDRALPRILSAAMKAIREQTNAECPARESGAACTWATKDFGDKLASVIDGPLFAALADVMEKLRKDEGARREAERFMTYLLAGEGTPDATQATLASLADAVQILADDTTFAPILNAAAVAANDKDDPEGKGALVTGLDALKALTSDAYDKHHILDHVLPNLVTPLDGGKNLAPLEIIMDTIADVNRLDASKSSDFHGEPLTTDDYKAIFDVTRDFMTDETRGLEQFYAILQRRPRE